LVKARQLLHAAARFSTPYRVVPAQAGTQAGFHRVLTVNRVWPLSDDGR